MHCIAHRAARAAAGILLAAAAICGAGEAPHAITLPPETAVLTASPLPGFKIAVEKCGICHSADYISLQPPRMSLAQWTAEVVKMQHAYGAPIDDTEIKLLGVYLASTYGDASTVTAAELALVLPGSTAGAVSGGDARSKSEANIRAGGAGKWGAVPKPPFPNLSAADPQVLADFVLQQ